MDGCLLLLQFGGIAPRRSNSSVMPQVIKGNPEENEDGEFDSDPEMGSSSVEMDNLKVKRGKYYTYFAGYRSKLVYPVGRAVHNLDLLTRLTEVSNETDTTSHATSSSKSSATTSPRSRLATQSGDNTPRIGKEDAGGVVPPAPHTSLEGALVIVVGTTAPLAA